MDATEFLNLILPDDGWRCAFVQQTKTNYFFKTTEELAAFLLSWDAAGYTVYHACATYKDPAGIWSEREGKQRFRTQENVHEVASLWADVDAGPGKPFTDATAAARAVELACSKAGLPAPLLVLSGRGLHVYWPLADSLGPGLWRRYATGLRAVLRLSELQFDPARACDAASILRTPGTTHRKEAPLPVVAAAFDLAPYELDRFAFLLEHADDTQPQAQATPAAAIPAPDHIRREKPARFSNPATYTGPERAAYSQPIAQGCGQIQRLRDWRVHRVLPEPVWYAALGVLAFAADGDECAHRWSEGHTAYNSDQTQERLNRCRAKLTGATTCSKFESLEPAICKACPSYGKIKSPISLGYRDSASIAPVQSQDPHAQAANTAPGVVANDAAIPSGTVGLPVLPRHFAWRGMSLVFQTENAGQPIEHLVSSYPLYLDAINEGETRGDFSLSFMQWLPNKGWFGITIAAKMLLQPNGIAELASHGANIHEGSHFIRYVRAAIDQHYETRKLRMRYDQYGWKADNTAFLYGRKLYTSQGDFEVSGSKELEVRNQWIGPGVNAKGDVTAFGVERWSQAANSLFAAGCEAQSVALLASFAAPLMRFMATDEGGAIISLVTRQSGTGKTTALAGASSVWGDRKGLSLTNDDNKVTKWLTLGALGNLPLVHDEIQTRDPIAIREFVINFTNGRDKMRATREGEIRHSASTWQTLLITASNSSLVDSLSGTSKADAPGLRVLELPLDVPDNLAHQLGDKLKSELIANAGYAGEVYARYLVEPEVVAFVKTALDKYTADIWHKTKLRNEYRFWVRATACIAVAALLVSKLELVDFSAQRIVDWLVARIGKQGKQGDGRDTGTDWATDALSDFISTESINFLVIPAVAKRGGPRMRPSREPRGKLSGCFAILERRLSLSINALRAYAVENEIPFREWVELLQRRGAASQAERRSLTSGTDVPGAQLNVIDFDMGHASLAGADVGIAVAPADDRSNLVPMRRR